MKHSKRGAFTLIELLVTIAIVAILAAILFPVFSRAREKGRQAVCISNLRQTSIALETYLQDNDEVMPYHLIATDWDGTYVNWLSGLVPYVRNTAVFDCPSNDDKYEGPNDLTLSYVYNRDLNGMWVGEITRPGEVIATLDGVQISCSFTGEDTFRDTNGMAYLEDPNFGGGPHHIIFSRHVGGGNCLFLDGHVKWLPPELVRGYLEVR